VWAGTDDGYIWVTRDDAQTWHNVTPRALTSWSKVGIIEASHFDANTAYAAIDRHRLDDYKPYIYRTRDGGASWTPVARGIPAGSFVNAVREDPKRRGLLFAGTEKGVYVSFDDGDDWQPLQLNLPVTSIRDIAIHGDDVIVATHGRSFWILDDITPLRQMDDAVSAGGVYLYAPAAAYRLQAGYEEGTPLPLDEPQSENAPPGLYVDYYLPGAARTPVVLEILAGDGSLVRRWSSAEPPKTTDPKSVPYTSHWIARHPVPSASAGAHRFVWDFHRDTHDGPLVPAGAYTVRLSVDGKTLTRSATVLRDPRAPASGVDLRAQYDLARRVAALRAEVGAARTKAEQLAKRPLTTVSAHALRSEIVGEEPPANPDDSVGAYSHDFTSFLYLENELDYLESAVESADAGPTPDMRNAYERLQAIYRKTLARLDALTRSP